MLSRWATCCRSICPAVALLQATLDEDRVRILDEIGSSIGFPAMDLAIREALVESARHELEQLEQQQSDGVGY